ELSATLSDIATPTIPIEQISLTNFWRSPAWGFDLAASGARGRLNAAGSLNATNREVLFRVTHDFDIASLRSLLATNAQKRLSEISWDSSPVVETQGRAVLPPWTKEGQDGGAKFFRSLSAATRVRVDGGAYRGTSFRSLEGELRLTNLLWRLS